MKRKRHSNISPPDLKAKKSSYQTIYIASMLKVGGYAVFRSFRSNIFGIRRKDVFPSLKVIKNHEMNPKHLALNTLVNVVHHKPPTHQDNDNPDEILVDDAVNVHMFEDGLDDDGDITYRRCKNNITE